jgi:predicted RNA binding protein YcfA (HicA-like mRNA interferase family)
MVKWRPCTRKEFIKKLKAIGFTSPEPGGRHFFMRYGTYTLTIPSNREYSIPQLKMLLHEIEEGIGRKINLFACQPPSLSAG